MRKKQKLCCVTVDDKNTMWILKIFCSCISSNSLGNLQAKWSQFDFEYYIMKSECKQNYFQTQNRTWRVYVVGKQELLKIRESFRHVGPKKIVSSELLRDSFIDKTTLSSSECGAKFCLCICFLQLNVIIYFKVKHFKIGFS